MTKYIKLKNTPIKEIVFTISFNEIVKSDSLDKFKSLDIISEKFDVISQGFNTELRAKQSEPPIAKVSTDGYIFKSKSTKKILQARKSTFSFHRIDGYEEFENLLSELEEIWSELIKCTGDLTINNYGLRYLNLINQNQDEAIEDLLNICVKQPFEKNVINTLAIIKINNYNNLGITGNITTATRTDVLDRGLVLDISIEKKLVESKTFSFASFNELREVKNNIFFKSITEKTIQKYNV